MDNKYSVLMSLYYNEDTQWFKQSVRSMLEQTIAPDEIILVLDGPVPDALMSAVNTFKENYSEIVKVIPLEKNVGLGKALDIGLEHCSNELVARMDTDDISLSDRCEKQLEKFSNNPELAILGTMTDEFFDSPDNIVTSRVVPTEYHDIKKFIRRRSPFNHPSVMFKKSAVVNSGGYGKLRRKQDLDLFSRMINYGYKGENIDESLLLFRSNSNNFKRRQSWSYVSNTIKAQYIILKRGHCNIFDFLYVAMGQLFIYTIPEKLFKSLSNNYLRERHVPEAYKNTL